MSLKSSTTIDEVMSMLDAMRERKAEIAGFEGLLTEISGALADILSHLEKPKAEAEPAENTALAELAKAIKGLSKLGIKPADVSVNVQPTPVQVTVPKPAVTIMPSDWTSLVIKVGKPDSDGCKSFTITKQ